MSVTKYEAKFTELAKFVPRLVDGEQERVNKFEMGLRTEIRKQVVPYELTTYADVVNKALIIEREVNEERMERERRQRKRAQSNDTQGQNNKNIKRSAKGAVDNKTQQIDGEPYSRCGKKSYRK